MVCADAVAYYDRCAADAVARQRSVSFADVHSRVAPLLPAPRASILDVGSGAGRDALALAALGHSVVAAEPSAGLLAAARAADRDAMVHWIQDGLPDLDGVRRLARAFEVVFCSAVLMHVPGGALAASLASIAAMLAPGGFVVSTIRAPREDDPPGVFHLHSGREVDAAVAAAGLAVSDRWREMDVARGDRWWDGFVLVRAGDRG